MSRGTDRRTVRIAPELWERAGRVAVSNDETLSDVMRRALEEYVLQAPATGLEPVTSHLTGGRSAN